MPKLDISHHKLFTGHKQSVYTLTKDGVEGFFTAGSEGLIVHWPNANEDDGEVFARLPEAIFSIYFDEINQTMMAGGQHGNLYILRKGETAKIIKKHESSIFWIGHFQEYYVSCSADGYIKSWDERGDSISQEKLSSKSLRCGWINQDELWVSGSEGRLWELDSDLEIIASHRLGTDSWFAIDCVNDWVFAVGRDAKLHRWNRLFLDESIQNAHWYSIHALKVSSTGEFLVTGSMDKSIRVWDPESLNPLASVYANDENGHKSSVNAVIWLDENSFVSVSDDGMVRCWKLSYSK
jgi:WD40 repeat protein